MMLIGTGDERLSLEVAEFGPPGGPDAGDLCLHVAVSVDGYSATDRFWVFDPEWRRFLDELRQLERSRSGHAELAKSTPEGLELRIASADALGHISVSGAMGRHRADGFLRQLQFGFRFDPSMLLSVLRELQTFAS